MLRDILVLLRHDCRVSGSSPSSSTEAASNVDAVQGKHPKSWAASPISVNPETKTHEQQ